MSVSTPSVRKLAKCSAAAASSVESGRCSRRLDVSNVNANVWPNGEIGGEEDPDPVGVLIGIGWSRQKATKLPKGSELVSCPS